MERPWLKFYSPNVAADLQVPDIFLPQILDETAGRFPKNPAVFFFGGKVNYAALSSHVNRFANALKGLGFKRGDRLGLLLANMPEVIISAYGALKAGGMAAFFDPLSEAEEIRRQLNDAAVETVVVLDLILPRVQGVFPQTKVKKWIIASVKDFLPFPRSYFFSLAARGRGLNVKVSRQPNYHFFMELIQSASSDPPPPNQGPGNPDEPAVIQYTSGTAGPAKGVLLSHRNLVANVLQAAVWAGDLEKGKEAFLSILPFHHSYGMTLAMNLPIYLGAMSVHLPRFETAQALAAIQKHRLTFFPVTPSMVGPLSTYLGLDKKKVSSLRPCWAIGGPLAEEAVNGFERILGNRIVPFYGLTEASPLTHAMPAAGTRKPASVGIPLPGTDARIVDLGDDGKDLPLGEPGELAVRGPQVMKGYWNNPQETSRVLRGGWLRTGDLARMDEEGFFYILGKVPNK